jgi:putative FmdB family regulatory protein
MPIYAYRCSACGHAKELLQKMSDPVLSVCPACGASTFVKQVTAAGFQLKGSGWYVTDFRGDRQAAAPAADGAPTESAPAAAEAPTGAAEATGAKKGDDKKADANKAETKAAAPAPAPAASAAAPASPSGGGSK